MGHGGAVAQSVDGCRLRSGPDPEADLTLDLNEWRGEVWGVMSGGGFRRGYVSAPTRRLRLGVTALADDGTVHVVEADAQVDDGAVRWRWRATPAGLGAGHAAQGGERRLTTSWHDLDDGEVVARLARWPIDPDEVPSQAAPTLAEMCGRFVSASTPDQIAAYFGAEPPETELTPSYNVAPTTDVYAVVEGPDGARRVEVFHWGLIPVWAKDMKIGQKMINARSETIATKGAFKSDFKKHRCIIPMDGFYEWQALADRKAKQPHFIHRIDGEPLAVAGLWSMWRDSAAGPDAPWLHSCTVVTTSANDTMAKIHDRMPVILPASAWSTWLDRENQDIEALGRLLVPAPNELLTMHPISTDVNKVGNNDAHLIEPIDPDAGTLLGG